MKWQLGVSEGRRALQSRISSLSVSSNHKAVHHLWDSKKPTYQVMSDKRDNKLLNAARGRVQPAATADVCWRFADAVVGWS